MSEDYSMYSKAVNRVSSTPELEPYRYLLVEYDWGTGDEHYEWVAEAPLSEIVSWAEVIQQEESQG